MGCGTAGGEAQGRSWGVGEGWWGEAGGAVRQGVRTQQVPNISWFSSCMDSLFSKSPEVSNATPLYSPYASHACVTVPGSA